MKKYHKLQILQEDIDGAVRQRFDACVVARAFCRVSGIESNMEDGSIMPFVGVDSHEVCFYRGPYRKLKCSEQAEKFIRDFDNKHEVSPCVLEFTEEIS